jgi:hypothetical protein
MKLKLFPEHRCVVFELHAENDAEKALLNHLGTGHEAVACDGGYYCSEGTLRIFIKNPEPPPEPLRRKRNRKRNRK